MNDNHDDKGRFSSGDSFVSDSAAAYAASKKAQESHERKDSNEKQISANEDAASRHEAMAQRANKMGLPISEQVHSESAAAHRGVIHDIKTTDAKIAELKAGSDARIAEMHGKGEKQIGELRQKYEAAKAQTQAVKASADANIKEYVDKRSEARRQKILEARRNR